jgi:hypothetical protein
MRLNVYNSFRGHDDSVNIDRNQDGWYVKWVDIQGQCDKQGAPHLFAFLRSQSIAYPAPLGDYLLFLWDAAEEESLSEEEIQQELDRLAAWIRVVEENKPKNIGRLPRMNQ